MTNHGASWLIFLLFFVVVVAVIKLISLIILSYFQDAQRTLDICKSKGWDGVKSVSKYSNELECSNFTQAYIDSKGSR